MPNILKRLVLVGAASLFLLPAITYSQTKAQREDEKLKELVTRYFDDLIEKGALTQQKAFDYVKCTRTEYQNAALESPKAQALRKEYFDRFGLEMGSDSQLVMAAYQKMSAEKKAEFNAFPLKMVDENERLQDVSEERCMKTLGVKVPPGRAWGRY
ncbi:MAG: hypothetical protein LBE62_09975 [Azonexus sp.]|jgi:hypothetical protein|nr:hypothetical protein [Azonexus sp.]